MVIFPKPRTRGKVISIIRLPCISFSISLRIELEINATKTAVAASKSSTASKPFAESICSGLSELAERYKCMCDQLSSSTTRDLISSDQDKKWVEELIDVSLNLLDVCGNTWDMVTLFKEQVRDLHCALRRRKCENGSMKYKCFRKTMKKDVEMLVARLKQVNNMVIDSDNNQVAAEVKGVIEKTVIIFESLLLYLSTPTSKPSIWSSVVSKLIHKGKVACEDQTQEEKMQFAKSGLEKEETLLDSMETRLECIFRCLIRTRASLLNIISLHWNS
ncbi:hypothetical protein HanRHA438_Chr07g0304971 [Helianthus annuus]|uniref:Uncharacterized protein n=1 Tax=Helianthus annuus TaxID=4232 RepID=A0A251UB97_HELAN|nr:uncharacterized protein LOC110866698 [Helianthus annuus]KAF5798597.1 hypothetical protein HanXRQr2_Chr07g0294771 [Helianthus annuus]KAJ0550176.1 hypothetical protein HanHA300_Chr07g0242411 [Helianthus annuus]KAJ0563132.1 hypothetical protein HanHA89_Chr07g0259621 [Helianthus annuus]KAJ0728498.1 hypothetical protein HanLR1_Chr07g0242291 [Helianthus annuus]KAJ0731250.1 hypothetical protein HanOQP8_Chr07g0249801 [Helianthus annuus]